MRRHIPLLALLACFSAAPADAAVIARWSMDETSGNISDSSGNGFTGIASASGLTYGQASVPAGTYGLITVGAADAANFGTAINFNRTVGGYFDVGAPSLIESLAEAGPTGQFSVTAWVKASVPSSTNPRVFSTGVGGVDGWAVGLSNVDQVIFTANGVADRRSTTAPSSNNVWQHVAWTWNAGAINIFINGSSVFTSTAGFKEETSTNFRIGGAPSGAALDWFNGSMDDVEIHDVALDQSGVIAAAAIPEPSGPILVFIGAAILLARRDRQACKLDDRQSY